MPGIEIKGRSKIANYRHGGRTGKFGGGRTDLLEELGRVEGERSNPNRRAEISRVHGELNRGYAKGGRAGHAHGMSAGKKAITKIVERLGGGEEGKPHSTRAGRRAAGVRRIKRFTDKKRGLGRADISSIRKGLKSKAGAFKTHGRIGFQEGKRVDVPPSSQWKKPSTSLTREGVKDLHQQIKDRPKKLKFRCGAEGGRATKAEGGRIGLKKGGSDKKWMQKVSASIKKRGTKGKCTPITKPGCTGRAKALAKTFKKIAARRKG